MYFPDYTADFPLQGPVTFAIAAVLLDIINEAELELKCLPLAISCVDKTIQHIGPNIKRAIDTKIAKATSTSDLFCKIDLLYKTKKSVLGPACKAANIDEAWLQSDTSLPADTVFTNHVIVELVRYVKVKKLQWSSPRQWLCRIFPDKNCDILPEQTISSNWLRIQRRAGELRNTKGEAAYLGTIYSPPTVTLPQEVPSTSRPGTATGTATTGGTTAGSQADLSITEILTAKYDSPTKTKLIKHIHEQNKVISKLNQKIETFQEKLEKVNNKYTDVVNKYLTAKKDKKSIVKVNKSLEKEMKELEQEEIVLRSVLLEKDELIKESEGSKLTSQLESKEKTIQSLNETVKNYKEGLAKERKEMSQSFERVYEELQTEKGKKRREQKRVWWYKNKTNPLQEYKDSQIRELLKDVSSLKLENDDLACQLEDALQQPSVNTFADGKYVDAIRLVVYDFLSRNVGTKHVSALIESVLKNLAGVECGRLPKETLVKLMALEADILSKKQVAKALINSPNATIHMDATSKKQRHFFSIQISTADDSFSAGLVETVSGDTATQLEVTRDFFKDLSYLLDNDELDPQSNEYRMLFNVKNSMADRGPTSRSWVEQMEVWREDVLKKNLLPGHDNLSAESIAALSKINDFYCGKHFLLGLAERTKVGLMLWEGEVADVTGQIGMEALPEFSKWNCQKPAGLRLIRTSCELVGSGAKDPHGIPEDFNAHLSPGETNHIPFFEHNRFNIVFKAASAVYHHRSQLRRLLEAMQNDNRLHRAVLEDSGNPVVLAEVQAISMLEKHITTPLATITSKKEHILELRRYYTRLREFLQDMIKDPTPILDGSAVLFDDCPPIKDEVWSSIYQEVPEEQEALLDQLVSVLCASFFVVCERQLFDFLHGKWASEQTEAVRSETSSVPRNNDISERDFSGLDRLLRAKATANLDFIEGLILFVNNKTGDYLKQLSPSELNKEIKSAMCTARAKAKHFKEKKASLRQKRKEIVIAKQKHREELQKNRMIQQQKIQDDVRIDGQAKSPEDVDTLLVKYSSVTEQKKAFARQLKFYRTLKVPGVPSTKFFITSQGKALSIENLKENLLFIISSWNSTMLTDSEAAPLEDTPSTSTSNIQSQSQNINTLKRKLVEEAEAERQKKAKKYKRSDSKRVADYPGDAIIGRRIRHRYEVASSGKVTKRWYKGIVLRRAAGDELMNISEEDQDIVNQGYFLYMVKYDKEDQIEPFALRWDWENGDLELI